jgi:hypothetical protein
VPAKTVRSLIVTNVNRKSTLMSDEASEDFYSILKRGITGTYHSISEAHLHRYLKEFDFR